MLIQPQNYGNSDPAVSKAESKQNIPSSAGESLATSSSRPLTERQRQELEVGEKFVETVANFLWEHGQRRKKGFSPQRFTEIADKVVRIVQESHRGRIPRELPQNSPAFADSRVIGLLNSVEFFPVPGLTSVERSQVIKAQVHKLYPFFRERFVSDITGRPMFEPKIQPKVKHEFISSSEDISESSPAKALETPDTFNDVSLEELQVPSGAEQLRNLETADVSQTSESDYIGATQQEVPPVEAATEESAIASVQVLDGAGLARHVARSEVSALARVKPFTPLLLASRVQELTLPSVFKTFLAGRTDIISILDLMNLTREELREVTNVGTKRLLEVEEQLSRLHPALGLLFSEVKSFPIPYVTVLKLEETLVRPSLLINGRLISDSQSIAIPIDNGFRLLQLTADLAKKVGITEVVHRNIAELFYEVGFPRPV